MRNFILAILIACGMSPAASAADIRYSTKDTPAHVLPAADEPDRSWTGLWGAALLGYSMSNTEIGFDVRGYREDDGLSEILGVDGFGGEGFEGTLQLGGDVQVRGVVLGGWGEYTFGGTDSEIRAGGQSLLTVEQNDSYGVFARVGVPSGDTLFYAAGGYVWTEADVNLAGGFNRTFEFSGPAAEAGVEHRFTPNVRGKLSARYTWLDGETVASFEDEGGETLARLTAEPGVWSVKLGVVISTGGVFGN